MGLFGVFKKKTKQANKTQYVAQDYTVSLTDDEKRLLLECEYCGRPVCFYDGVAKKVKGYDAKATNLKGKCCCGSCYKELFPTSTEECSICKNTVPLSQIFHFINGKEYCINCWEKELKALNSFYDRYTEMLTNYLLQNNIKIDLTKKLEEIKKEASLIESDVLYEVCNNEITVAFNCYQRIKISRMSGISNVDDINEKLIDVLSKNKIYDILSVHLSGNVVYVLTQTGKVFSLTITPFMVTVSEENKIFSPKEELLFIALKANGKEYDTNKHLIADRYYCIPLADHTYYDIEQKCFFKVYTSGSYHDGYEIGYGVIKREKIIEYLSTRFDYYIYANETLYNEELSFIFSLSENDEMKEINPTPMFENAIYGKEYI